MSGEIRHEGSRRLGRCRSGLARWLWGLAPRPCRRPLVLCCVRRLPWRGLESVGCFLGGAVPSRACLVKCMRLVRTGRMAEVWAFGAHRTHDRGRVSQKSALVSAHTEPSLCELKSLPARCLGIAIVIAEQCALENKGLRASNRAVSARCKPVCRTLSKPHTRRFCGNTAMRSRYSRCGTTTEARSASKFGRQIC